MFEHMAYDTVTAPITSQESVEKSRLLRDWERVKSNFSKVEKLTPTLAADINSFNTKVGQYIGDPNAREYMRQCVDALSRLVDSNGNLIPTVTEGTFSGLSGFTYERLGNDHDTDVVAKHVLRNTITGISLYDSRYHF